MTSQRIHFSGVCLAALVSALALACDDKASAEAPRAKTVDLDAIAAADPEAAKDDAAPAAKAEGTETASAPTDDGPAASDTGDVWPTPTDAGPATEGAPEPIEDPTPGEPAGSKAAKSVAPPSGKPATDRPKHDTADKNKPESPSKSKPASEPDDAKPEPAAAAAIDGQALFGKKCKNCHGPTGNGDTKIGRQHDIEDWTEPGWKSKWPESKVIDIVTNGKAKTKMKPFRDKLSADEIVAVAKYARSLAK